MKLGMRLKNHLSYQTTARWNHETGGTAQLEGFTLDFDTPNEYGGEEEAPCPDQLFMASIAGCIINTFNYYRNMLKVETKDLAVDVSSDIELTKNDGYRIKKISIKIQVWCSDDEQEKNLKCAERAKDFCHLSKSIEPAIPINTTIQVYTE
jgi:organic hydroperoxide reductase OsmC/OhrA